MTDIQHEKDMVQEKNKEQETVKKTATLGIGRVLAFDTSTASMAVAVLEGNQLIGERKVQADRNHSIYLFPIIQELLESLHMRPETVQGFSVGVGPGSYTGVRIAVTAAKTMAWTLGKPVVGVSSLAALALGAVLGTAGEAVPLPLEAKEVVWIVPLMNARRGQAFTALFIAEQQDEKAKQPESSEVGQQDESAKQSESSEVGQQDESAKQSLSSEVGQQDERLAIAASVVLADGLDKASIHVTSVENEAYYFEGMNFIRKEIDGVRLLETWVGDLLHLIAEATIPPSRIAFVGEIEGFQEWIDTFAARWKEGLTIALPLLMRAYHVGRLAEHVLESGGAADAHELMPNYTQLAEAEVNLLAKRREEAR
ncbi:MAG: tRNA (adenosine(37)-N6)-threonylcarbamoyltransferase complex dimerization subunit type 1 TsaB [Gorillibacterium sp.]|nr:tRNA (adenosine(37)-N6)-threonylcarbamoyltransferase complex dimerization subunit type 1 TsaB [Gorillibacterium sp.]